MLVTGIILAPAALATPAMQDFDNLRVVINSAASTIGDANNPNKGWGFSGSNGGGQMGTADLVNNITTTVLGMKYQIDTNKTAWTTPDLNGTNPAPTPSTPTLPLSSSIPLPSIIPSATPNVTIDLSALYMDYVAAIPNLSTSLTTLGRAFHREMNLPVHEAISGLEQAITTLQSALLQDNFINSQAVVRTLRASSSLANAQTAWGRFLNLPGRSGSSDSDDNDLHPTPVYGVIRRDEEMKQVRRPPPSNGRYYTHEELWSRDGEKASQPQKESAGSPGISAENARVGVSFVA